MLTIRAMSNAQGYSARHLEHSDYYAEGERVIGQWQGRGAELLGLSGDVESEHFEAIRQGLDPHTGEFLRQRQSADRIAADGTTQSHGRHLYDFTISAPKSVSIMARLGDDGRLIEAHQKAVGEALKELESYAATRVRQDLANEDRTTGNLVLAVYHHDTSRELDPQLHTHAVAGNMTWDGAEGRWKALQASDIYERRAYLSEVYRNGLAREVRGLGYEIEDRRDAKGRDVGFEIRGVSDALLEKYSQRSRQRDDAIDQFTRNNGRPPTDNEVAVLVRESRADKLLEISTAEVRERQNARLTPAEAQTISWLRENALAAANAHSRGRENASPSLLYAQEHIFERVSVARDHELLTEALRHGRGRIALKETKGLLQLGEASGQFIRAGDELATRNSLDREQQMIAAVNRGVAQFEPLGGNQEFVASDRLRPEQKHAVEFVLSCRDRAVNIRGAAGTGKTATLHELHRGLAEAGREVLAIAPTMSAVEELQKVGFSNATTIQRWLQDHRAQTEACGKVLIVDEAGMVSARQMAELLQCAERQSARIVFSGDTRQIQSVEAGDALRILEKESHLKSTSLTQVQRQTALDYREAIQELRRNPDHGFEKLEQIGAIHQVPWQERARAVAQAWRDAGSQLNGNGNRNVLVVCATHEEIDNVTEAIRADRMRTGELGESAPVERFAPQNYTSAQKSEPRNFREGQVLVFHRATKDIGRNEILQVVRVDRHKIVARNDAGRECNLTAKQAKCFEVYQRRVIEVAPNDKLVLTANRRETGFRATNGETVTVSGLNEHGRIQLADGRTLPANYQHFDYGYAVTAHRSQGKSVDAVVISGDAMKKELFYVAASRGRESVTVVTSDKELLRQSVARSGQRQSATELVRKITVNQLRQNHSGLARGVNRGTIAAREMARYAARQERDLGIQTSVRQQEITRESPVRDRGMERRDYGLGR
jgi:conjugative relaxase-like TrwC/TraI family protein